jgi:outer membrane lipoprotein-sorting protein
LHFNWDARFSNISPKSVESAILGPSDYRKQYVFIYDSEYWESKGLPMTSLEHIQSINGEKVKIVSKLTDGRFLVKDKEGFEFKVKREHLKG